MATREDNRKLTNPKITDATSANSTEQQTGSAIATAPKPASESINTKKSDQSEEARHAADTIKQIQIPPDPTS